MDIFGRFFAVITCFAFFISLAGFILIIKTLFFCIKRYILTILNVNTDLSTSIFYKPNKNKELSPNEIVEKRLLKDKLGKFARDTLNEVKSNNYLSERKEGVIDEEYQKEMKQLSDIYIGLDKMSIQTPDELEEVSFLFNNGKLRSDEEISLFYKNRDKIKIEKDYEKNNFVKDLIHIYEEDDITDSLVFGSALFSISLLFFVYKFNWAEEWNRWTSFDAVYFICDSLYLAFNPFLDGHTYNYDNFWFSCSLIVSTILSFIIGDGIFLINEWCSNSRIAAIYERAGKKKKKNIILGINTASYFYIIHRLFK